MGFIKTAFRNWLGLTNENLKPTHELDELRKDILTQNIQSKNRELNEYWLWYTGTAQKLTMFYQAYLQVPAKQDYFYARTRYEDNKKTHSGLPKVMVDTLTNVTGIPSVTLNVIGKDENDEENKTYLEERQALMEEIIDFNDFKNIIKQDVRAKTLVIGGGAIFVSNLREQNEAFVKPIIEFVDERFCEIETVGNIFVAATKKTDYKVEGKIFTHYERRSYNLIENWLVDDSGNRVSLSKVPELAELEDEIVLKIDMIPAVPVRYKNGTNNTYGMSIYSGKLDLFDDYDQTTSQLAELVRKSTPIEYLPGDLLSIDKRTGEPIAPTVYDRKFITLKKSMRQDSKEQIEIHQPELRFAEIVSVGINQLTQIFNGIISPASLGINVGADASGESVREKERVTFVTRDDIIDNEIGVVKRVLELALRIDDYMNGREFVEDDVHVDYPDFSSPTFDKLVQTLLPMWAQKAISPEKFIDLLYGDNLSEEEREKELAWLNKEHEPVLDFNFLGENEPSIFNKDKEQEDADKEPNQEQAM